MFPEDPPPPSRTPAREGRPSAPEVTAAVGADTRHRFGLLLAALLGSFFLLGVGPEGTVGRALVTVLTGGTLLLALWVAEMPPRRLRLAILLVSACVAGAVGTVLATDGDSAVGANAVVNGLLIAAAPPAVVVGVSRSLRTRGAVTVQAVFGALCFYLLVGLFFAYLYGAIGKLGGEPFFANGLEATQSRDIYFSFTTLTSVGYGDFTARTDLGHTLSAMEALIGQVYLVTVVALVVANLAPRRPLRR